MGDFSSSSNVPAGDYVASDSVSCDWCPRPAEWRFALGRPRIGADVDHCRHVYGCGIHWKMAADYARSTKK